MKPVLVCASLSLMSAFAFAAEPVAAAAESCAAPVIPPVSTSTVGLQRVQKAIKQWDDCVANQETDENIRLDEEVKAKAKAWLAATIQYSNGQAAGNAVPMRHEFERVEWRLTFAERQRAKASLNNVPMERTENRMAMAPEPRRENQ